MERGFGDSWTLGCIIYSLQPIPNVKRGWRLALVGVAHVFLECDNGLVTSVMVGPTWRARLSLLGLGKARAKGQQQGQKGRPMKSVTPK